MNIEAEIGQFIL